MSRQKYADEQNRGAGPGGGEAGAAEAKRQAARRRFLLGGAGALPVIVTLGQKQALAASMEVCQSAGLHYGEGFTPDDFQDTAERARGGGLLKASLYCRPENL